jgi:hypothetical protein
MRIKLPDFNNKKDLHKYLIENKKTLISQKKSMPIFSESFISSPSIIHSKKDINKSNTPVQEDVDRLRVKVVANTANWIDSHLDMLLPNCWAKSIQERKSFIPHLHDHIHRIDAKVGEVVDIFSTNVTLQELGISGVGTTESLIFLTDIIKSYNEIVFNQYKQGRINQHSIGLQYVKLELAINDEDYEKELDFWNKYYPQVINKEKADKQGFFWVVQEIKLIENSAVLFGSNELTPTLDNNVKGLPGEDPTEQQPENSADEEDNTLLAIL